MPCYGHKYNSDRLDGQAVSGQNSSELALCSQVDEKDYPDQQAGSPTEYEVHQEDTL